LPACLLACLPACLLACLPLLLLLLLQHIQPHTAAAAAVYG